jgi:hypothetical protein
MKRNFMFVALVISAWLLAQQPPSKPPARPEEIVRDWMQRWTELDGSDASAAKFAELYLAEGVHETGPNARQRGLVYYEGQSDITKMAKAFGEANGEITFRIAATTANEKSADLIHVTDGPWGGQSISIEYITAYTQKKDKKRYMAPGAAFIQIQNGKIRRTRLYAPREEISEIVP